MATFHVTRRSYFGYLYAKPLLKALHVQAAPQGGRLPHRAGLRAPVLPGDYSIIPNGIDIAAYTCPGEPIPELQDGKINLFVGRLDKRKG